MGTVCCGLLPTEKTLGEVALVMTETFLAELMQFALTITRAERGMAVNGALEVIALEKLTPDEVRNNNFTGLVNIRQAYEANEAPHITNNIILDPEMAPNTNTNLANLRLVVVFLFGEVGAVYIDQHVRRGVVNQHVVRQVQKLADLWVANQQFSLTRDEMFALYQAQQHP